MDILSEAKISPAGKLNRADLEKLFNNFLKFVAPTLVIFFGQLALGVSWQKAAPVALLALYQSLADIFSKLNDGPKK
jgi:hypothetical protein